MSAPPKFLPVLFGHGRFFMGENGNVLFDEKGNPCYLIPPSDAFLEMQPSKQSQQFWPSGATRQMPENTSIVLLSISVNTHCQQPRMITEIGYTIFDTAAIYDGAKGAKGGRKNRIPGCMAPGPRGENITKLAFSRHFIVNDTAWHHPGTCNLPNHTAQPYHFTYRKSQYIHRGQIDRTLEEAFDKAVSEGLSFDEVRRGVQRTVVLVGWGDENYHPRVQATSWYRARAFFQSWDIRQHDLIQGRLFNPTYLACLDLFGIQHRAYGREIGNNAGNHSAFTIQLLIGMCFLTEEQRDQLSRGLSLAPNPRFPGVESVLARDNRPPGSQPLTGRFVPIMH